MPKKGAHLAALAASEKEAE